MFQVQVTRSILTTCSPYADLKKSFLVTTLPHKKRAKWPEQHLLVCCSIPDEYVLVLSEKMNRRTRYQMELKRRTDQPSKR